MLSRLTDIVERDDFVNQINGLKNDREVKEYLLHNERYITVRLSQNTVQYSLVGKKLMEINLPSDVLVALIERDGFSITPRGDTELHENDILTIIGEPKSISSLMQKYIKG